MVCEGIIFCLSIRVLLYRPRPGSQLRRALFSILDLHHELARVDTLVQICQTLRRNPKAAFENGLVLLHLALGQPL